MFLSPCWNLHLENESRKASSTVFATMQAFPPGRGRLGEMWARGCSGGGPTHSHPPPAGCPPLPGQDHLTTMQPRQGPAGPGNLVLLLLDHSRRGTDVIPDCLYTGNTASSFTPLQQPACPPPGILPQYGNQQFVSL